jgi:pimeloyl-ACP methyl ester carboxylesterase
MECVVKNIPVHHEVSGSSRPIIVVHGTPLDHRSVKASLEPIFSERHGWNRIYPDLPGHGKTPGANWIMNFDQMVEVVVDFIEAVIPSRRLR